MFSFTKLKFADLDKQQIIATAYFGAAASVIGGTAIFALFKFRVIQKFCSPALAEKIDRKIEEIAQATAPSSKTNMTKDRAQIDYLTNVYKHASLGFILGGLGTYLFTQNNYIPIVPPTVICGAAFASFYAFPDRLPPMFANPTFALCCFMGGITMGPMNIIAQKTNSLLFATAMSTTVAFSITPSLTRGWIANALLSQALSSSIAVIATKFIAAATFPDLKYATLLHDAEASPAEKLLSVACLPLNLDNLLVGQIIYNAALVYWTGRPVLEGLVPPCELTNTHAQKDALMVVGSVTAAIFRLFQYCVQFVINAIKASAQNGQSAARGERLTAKLGDVIDREDLKKFTDPVSGGVSLVTFFLLYIQFVQKLQSNGSAEGSFKWLKAIFERLTPVRLGTLKKAPTPA